MRTILLNLVSLLREETRYQEVVCSYPDFVYKLDIFHIYLL